MQDVEAAKLPRRWSQAFSDSPPIARRRHDWRRTAAVEDVRDDLGQVTMRERVKGVRSDEVQGVEQQRGIERVMVHRREEVFTGGAVGASGVRARGLVAGSSREWGQTIEGGPGFK